MNHISYSINTPIALNNTIAMGVNPFRTNNQLF